MDQKLQRTVYDQDPTNFKRVLDNLLAEGWELVPGSTYITATNYAVDKYDPRRSDAPKGGYVVEHGTIHHYFAVVQKDR